MWLSTGEAPIRMFTQLREMTSRLARRSLTSNSAPGVHVAGIDVEPVFDGTVATFDVTYHLSSAASSTRLPLLFDCVNTPAIVTVAESSRGRVRMTRMRADPERASILAISHSSAKSWDETCVRLRLSWEATGTSSPDAFALPDFLPALISPAVSGQRQPLLDVLGSVDGLSSTRLPGCDGPGSVLRMVLFPSGLVHPGVSPESPVVLNQHYFGHLKIGEVRRIERLVDNVLAFLADFFGSLPTFTTFVTPARSLLGVEREPMGALLAASPAWFGLRGHEPADMQLVMRLAGIWWGAGIRVVGRNASEAEAAIRATAGLAWLRFIGEEAALARALENVRSSERSRVPQWLDQANGVPGRRFMARTIGRLIEEGAADPASTRLRDLTAGRWGTVVDSSVLLGS